MNGPFKLYGISPVVRHNIEVDLPQCMYRMKNIHKERNGVVAERSSDHVSSSEKKLDIFDQVKQFLKNNQDIPGLEMLEARQQQILAQLAELKKQLLSIKSSLNATNNVSSQQPPNHISSKSSSCSPQSGSIQINGLPEVVIYASPHNPPYSVEIIQKLWQSKAHVSVKTYIHSTVTSLTPNAESFASTVENFKPSCCSPRLNIKIIWKDVGRNTQFLISRLPIIGETNILRYLARISDNLNYEQQPNPHEIDTLLDVCHRIILSKTKTERAGLLQVLNKSLGKSQFLTDRSEMTIVDIAAFSVLKQIDPSEVSVNLGKLVQRIESLTRNVV